MDISFQFAIPSDPRFLALIRATVAETGAAYGLPDDECRGISLAVDEALTNVIRHAYHRKMDQVVDLSCQAHADRLEFALTDRGDPPDPARIRAQPLDDSALG